MGGLGRNRSGRGQGWVKQWGEKKGPSRQVVERDGEGYIQGQAQGSYPKMGTERMRDCLREETEASLGHLKCEGPGTTCEEAPRRAGTGDGKQIGVLRAQAGTEAGMVRSSIELVISSKEP